MRAPNKLLKSKANFKLDSKGFVDKEKLTEYILHPSNKAGLNLEVLEVLSHPSAHPYE